MGAEIIGPMPPVVDTLRCQDRKGNQLFPVERLIQASGLVRLLASEFDQPIQREELLVEDVSSMSCILENVHASSYTLQHSGGPRSISEQRHLQECVAKRVEYGSPQLVRGFMDIRDAVRGIVPQEVDFFRSLAITGYKPEEEDYARAGQQSQPPAAGRARADAPKLQENTPENLEELTKIVDSLDALMLLESQGIAAQLLDICMAFGSRRDIRAAVSISRRLSNLAIDSQKEPLTKIIDQRAIGNAAVRQTELVTDHSIQQRASSSTVKYIEELAEGGEQIPLGHQEISQVFHHVINSRAFRLNGNTSIRLTDTADQSKPETSANQTATEELASKAAPSPKPEEEKPDLFNQYTTKFHDLLARVSCRQPALLTAKEIKRRSLDEARAILVRGEHDEDGATIISGRSKSEAQRFISNVEFLCDFITESGDINHARSKLDQAITETSAAVKRIKSFFEEAGEKLDLKTLSRLQSKVPSIQPVDGVISEVKNEWDAVSWLVWEYWPNGPQTAQQLRKLVFFSESEEKTLAA